VSIRSLRAAVSFLTVLPVANADGSAGERLGRAYFPAIGALIGLGAGIGLVVTSASATPLLGAAVAVALLCLLTGAIHLDGVADTADGLLAAGDVQRRLAVMRDPHLGSYGVTAVVMVLVLDVSALASMPAERALLALVIAGALSRLATVSVIAFVPYVRASGLGTAAWDRRWRGVDLAIGGASAGLLSLLDWRRAVVAVPVVALTTLVLVVLARRRVGGATGDVCGATAELSQLATLIVFAVLR
jgi:adenosylcobinamide-GDP ribazoletransferase